MSGRTNIVIDHLLVANLLHLATFLPAIVHHTTPSVNPLNPLHLPATPLRSPPGHANECDGGLPAGVVVESRAIPAKTRSVAALCPLSLSKATFRPSLHANRRPSCSSNTSLHHICLLSLERSHPRRFWQLLCYRRRSRPCRTAKRLCGAQMWAPLWASATWPAFQC